MSDNKKRVISIESANNILQSDIDARNCHKCIYRNKDINFTCRVISLTMMNSKGECIWFQEGAIADLPLNIELAKKRMDGAPIYLSTWDVVI